MYYKITDKDSLLYKELRALREDECRMNEENLAAIKKRIPYKWTDARGRFQIGPLRTNMYQSFLFADSEHVDPEIWEKHSLYPGYFRPNEKTQPGKDMYNFLTYELPQIHTTRLYAILNPPVSDNYAFPFLELVVDTLLLFVDDRIVLREPCFIEITSVEFKARLETYYKMRKKYETIITTTN